MDRWTGRELTVGEDSYLDRIASAVGKRLNFPEKTTVHGFNGIVEPGLFREISEMEGEQWGTISAIDGGSCTILRTPCEVFMLNRAYCNSFDGMNKLSLCERVTFISRTSTVTEGSNVFFQTEIYPVQGECDVEIPKVDSADEEFRVGKLRGDLERASSLARRFCEWCFVRSALRCGADFILMDGALQTGFPKEANLANDIYQETSSSGIILAGLSKTSTIYTDDGYPVAGLLDVMAEKRNLKKWLIKIGTSDEWTHNAIVNFIKLHDEADRAYRLDVYKETAESDLARLVGALQANSKYFAYPGYPYALIDAHTYAKVGWEESMHIRDLVLDRLRPEEAKRLEQTERALTGHEILDQLR